jgi:predicted GIY-YIG superfamily endonuclease
MGADPTPAGPHGHPVGTCYLLHFDQRYEHAGHYTGWATDLDRRLPEHLLGRGARLLEVITQAGIGFRLARTWPGVTRARERQLKNQGGASRYCPICQDQRKARGLPRRPTPTPNGRQQPAGLPARPGATSVPTRGVHPDQARTFLWLNPAFARPVDASPAAQWGRVRGREAVELAGPRVTVAWFDENRQLTQRRVAAIGRRATRAQARAHAEQAEQARTRALAARTRQRLAARQPQQRAAGRQPARARREAEHER